MHDEEGPRRLRGGADTPEALQRALTAMRKGIDDSARLQRVGQNMEALLTSPPSAAQLSARRGLFGQKLSALKLIIAGLGLLAPLFFFQLMDDATTVPSSEREGSPLPSAAPQNIEKVEPPQVEAPQVVVAAAEETATSSKRVSRSSHAAALRPRKQRERSAPEAQPSGALAPAANVNARNDAPAEQPSNEAVAGEPSAPAERVQPKAAAKQHAPNVSEAELLLRARQALKRDPALALRLASEHESQYADGRLTPEREVLAIEALRSLGRRNEANERLHKFEARYPGSIHLKRLHESH